MTEIVTTTGPITIEDVRQALGSTDPTSTNASALRGVLGRGSFATIQRHLDAIRLERAPAPAQAPGAAPVAPAEAVAAIWAAAWSAAQVQTLGRLEHVTVERDQLALTVAQLGQDLAAALAQVDAAADQAAVIGAQTAEALASADSERSAAVQSAELAKQAQEATRTAMEALQEKFEATVTAMEKDAVIAAQALQATIDRLTDQVGELKSMLPRQAQG